MKKVENLFKNLKKNPDKIWILKLRMQEPETNLLFGPIGHVTPYLIYFKLCWVKRST